MIGHWARARFGAAAVLALCNSAHSADLSSRYGNAPVIGAPLYDWSGFYIGGSFGGAFSREIASTPLGDYTTDPSGVLGGVQIGYNVLFSPNWLVGIEGQFDWTTTHGVNLSYGAPGVAITSNHNWYDTLDGRLGIVQGPLLYYVQGGVAWMNADEYLTTVIHNQTATAWVGTTRTGWNLGAGLEYMLAPNWSAKLEYEFLEFGNENLAAGLPIPGASIGFATQVHQVKLGVNYHWIPGTLFGIF